MNPISLHLTRWSPGTSSLMVNPFFLYSSFPLQRPLDSHFLLKKRYSAGKKKKMVNKREPPDTFSGLIFWFLMVGSCLYFLLKDARANFTLKKIQKNMIWTNIIPVPEVCVMCAVLTMWVGQAGFHNWCELFSKDTKTPQKHYWNLKTRRKKIIS